MPIAAFGVSDKVHKWQSTEHALLRAASERSGDGPVELRAGPHKVLITRRSAEAWERRFEKQAANDDSAGDAA